MIVSAVRRKSRLPSAVRRIYRDSGGGRGEERGGPAPHPVAIARRRMAGADRGADFGERQPRALGTLADAPQRVLQGLLDVVSQGLQRGDIDDLRAVRQGPRQRLHHQPVDRPEEGGQGLTGAGGCGDQRVPAGAYPPPAGLLRRSRAPETLAEPASDQRVKERLAHDALIIRVFGSPATTTQRTASASRRTGSGPRSRGRTKTAVVHPTSSYRRNRARGSVSGSADTQIWTALSIGRALPTAWHTPARRRASCSNLSGSLSTASQPSAYRAARVRTPSLRPPSTREGGSTPRGPNDTSRRPSTSSLTVSPRPTAA